MEHPPEVPPELEPELLPELEPEPPELEPLELDPELLPELEPELVSGPLSDVKEESKPASVVASVGASATPAASARLESIAASDMDPSIDGPLSEQLAPGEYWI
jgi:hypothetical protein